MSFNQNEGFVSVHRTGTGGIKILTFEQKLCDEENKNLRTKLYVRSNNVVFALINCRQVFIAVLH